MKQQYFSNFIVERCKVGNRCWENSSDLFVAFFEWVLTKTNKLQTIDRFPISQKAFVLAMRHELQEMDQTLGRGFARGRRCLIGICLKENEGKLRFESSRKILERLHEKQRAKARAGTATTS